MFISIYDTDHNFIDCRDNDEFRASFSYSNIGDFEISASYSREALSVYAPDNIVMIDKFAGVIERVLIENNDGVRKLSIYGSDLTSFLCRRIIARESVFTGKISTIIGGMVEYLEGIENRAMGFDFVCDCDDETDEAEEYSYYDVSYADAILDLCSSQGYAVRTEYQPENTKPYLLHLYKGNDKSLTSGNPVMFSTDTGNLRATSYEYNTKEYANYIYILGDGEGRDKIVTEYEPKEVTGLQRREVTCDATDIQRSEASTEQQYNRRVLNRGMEELALHALSMAVTGDVINSEPNKFINDYYVGDFVHVEDSSINLSETMQVSEVTISQTRASGYEISPVFSK